MKIICEILTKCSLGSMKEIDNLENLVADGGGNNTKIRIDDTGLEGLDWLLC